MKALVFSSPRQARVADVERPAVGPGEVLIASRVVGICHSDLELLSGHYIIPVSYPVVPGHEWSGEVVDAGPGVLGFREGDRVVGECVVGPGGRDHFGFSISGAAAEYFRVRAEWLHKLPEKLSFRQGALVEPFSVAYNATRVAAVDPSDSVAVLGGGPIGLLCVMAAVGRGASVVLVEPQPARRAKGLSLGAVDALDPGSDDFYDRVRELTGGRLFDVVIESAGNPQAMASSLRVAGRGGRVVCVGIDVGASVETELGLVQSKALHIRGIIGSEGIWPQAIRFLERGAVDPSAIVTARYGLEEAVQALKAADPKSGNIKVHIELGDEATP
jgi:L-iditol 2-dehydrogenase